MKIFTHLLITIGTIVLFVIIGAIIFTLCWNYVIPIIFGLPEITYLQAFCLMMLTNLLIPNNKK